MSVREWARATGASTATVQRAMNLLKAAELAE
jgi:DNA-binding transcriptional regulator YhcF (GntR family)